MAIQNLLVQPASGPQARSHWRRTMETPVALKAIEPFLSPADLRILEEVAEDGAVYMWGFEEAEHGLRNWNKLERGDLVVFYRDWRFFAKAVIVHKVNNPDLARHYWSINQKTGRTWSLIYFCVDLSATDVPVSTFNSIMKYSPDKVVQGSQVVEGSLVESLSMDEDEDEPWIKRLGIVSNSETKIPILEKIKALEIEDKTGEGSIRDLIDTADRSLAGKGLEIRRKAARLIIRHPTLSRYMKELHGHRCQVCKTPGFRKINGQLYAEAHHVEPLSRGGSPLSSNILVVCPTCHRKLHLATVRSPTPDTLIINDERYDITR